MYTVRMDLIAVDQSSQQSFSTSGLSESPRSQQSLPIDGTLTVSVSPFMEKGQFVVTGAALEIVPDPENSSYPTRVTVRPSAALRAAKERYQNAKAARRAARDREDSDSAALKQEEKRLKNEYDSMDRDGRIQLKNVLMMNVAEIKVVVDGTTTAAVVLNKLGW